jgi:hypothetical protein
MTWRDVIITAAQARAGTAMLERYGVLATH